MGARHISKRIRFIVLERDGFTCQYCGAKSPKVNLHVDHVHPKAQGGTDDPSNLITSCADCNFGKSDIIVSKRVSIWKSAVAKISKVFPYRIIFCKIEDKYDFLSFQGSKHQFFQFKTKRYQDLFIRWSDDKTQESFQRYLNEEDSFKKYLEVADYVHDLADRSKPKNVSVSSDELSLVARCVVEFHIQNGRCPGKSKIASMTGLTEHQISNKIMPALADIGVVSKPRGKVRDVLIASFSDLNKALELAITPDMSVEQ